MFLQNIKENHVITNENLSRVMKCTVKRVDKLLNFDAEILTSEIVKLCDHLNLWNDDNLSLMFTQAVEDNYKYRKKHGKKIRERYDSEK